MIKVGYITKEAEKALKDLNIPIVAAPEDEYYVHLHSVPCKWGSYYFVRENGILKLQEESRDYHLTALQQEILHMVNEIDAMQQRNEISIFTHNNLCTRLQTMLVHFHEVRKTLPERK